ncbi:alcohol dehydrogenase-like regulatory protein ErcA [Plebeiibacterium sediminum]|uniref:Iron-containing alcohol dehydrogenase n=1 Tax=Plebeiibacterium sediminum TaxID=2992112 RepID=A0AAE3M201_9BACT|nr:alcohol dehydrogenase-like regulatory protein ErcA [Plebeiobacterium sediminum]MCW3785382.1 iron-containing alcohol dehydrogenase [Plebeiobacterium sediminum]
MRENIQLNPRKFVAPEYIYGVDSRLMAGVFCKKLGGRKILLVTDQILEQSLWFTEVVGELEKHSIDYIVFSSISPNPRDYEVMNGKTVYDENKCNMILALGGGSVMDCAKGIGIVSSNSGHILDYKGVDMINIPIPPLICIPTTGGTAADVSQFAIINNTVEKYKFAIISKAVVPDVALIDPFILTSMDPFLTACTGMDALSHSFEAFVSNANSPFTDLYALESIRLINENLQNCIINPNDIQSRGKIMLASLYAGLAFSNASLGCVHSLAHSLGGYLDLPHGECNAILLPHVVDFNFDAANDRYLKIAEIFNISKSGKTTNEVKKQLIDYLLQFKRQLGIQTSLKDKGVRTDYITPIAAKAINDPCNATNPRPPVKMDLEAICKEAL